jgi:hypothetical protein
MNSDWLELNDLGMEVSLLHIVQTGSGIHPISYSLGSKAPSSGKAAGPGADHSPPTNAQVRKTLIYISTAPYVLRAQCLISYAQGQFLHIIISNTSQKKPALGSTQPPIQ